MRTTTATPHVLYEASALEVIPCTFRYSVGHQKVAWNRASVGGKMRINGAQDIGRPKGQRGKSVGFFCRTRPVRNPFSY